MDEEKNKTKNKPFLDLYKNDRRFSEKELKAIDELYNEQAAEFLNGWKRAKADLANFKKEEMERVQRMVKMGNEGIVRDVVGVLDSFDLGITALGAESAAGKGMILIKTQLEDALKRHGLESVRAEKGTMFDPAHHEALGEIESELPEGAVVEEIERGYRLNERAIRPVRVIVSKAKESKNK